MAGDEKNIEGGEPEAEQAPVEEASAEADEAVEPEADEAPGAEGEAPVEEAAEATEPVAETEGQPEPEAAAAERPPEEQAEEPVAEASDDVPVEEPVAPTEPASEAEPAEEAPAAEIPAAPPPQEARRKKKRLPRALRPKRTRPKREPSTERRPIVRLPKPEHVRGNRQERRGVVVSDAMDKTIVVKVEVIKTHRRYKKVIRRSRKFHAHDEQNRAKVGDVVRIVETRPLSKLKSWRLAEVLEEAK